MCACPRLHPPLHSGVEHGGHMLLGISPPGLLEVSDCVVDHITDGVLYLFGDGKWLRQFRQCRSASADERCPHQDPVMWTHCEASGQKAFGRGRGAQLPSKEIHRGPDLALRKHRVSLGRICCADHIRREVFIPRIFGWWNLRRWHRKGQPCHMPWSRSW